MSFGQGAMKMLMVALALAGATLSCSGCGAHEARTAEVAMQAPRVEVETAVIEPAAPTVIEIAPIEIAPEMLPAIVHEDRFFSTEDAPIRTALTTGTISEAERGHGGRSLGFRLTLDDGTQGYFKPDQTFNGMSWYAEIAAYHLDRELGFHRTAPSVGRRFAWEELQAAAGQDYRVDEIRVDEDGTVEGAFIYWVPQHLEALELPAGWEHWMRIEGEPDAVSPFQRANEYRAALAAHRTTTVTEIPEPDTADRPAELSDMIVFDYLTNNLDRWSNNHANVRTVGEHGPLMFLDNAAGFTLRGARVGLSEQRLRHVQRFRRSTIDAVRNLDVAHFASRLESDPLHPELSAVQLRNLETRRQALLAHVDALVEAHGEDEVYSF